MLLISIDIETTGLNPYSDQIIELAGVVIELNTETFEVSEQVAFESTIALRQELDPRITRLTGITEQELKVSKSITNVQEAWASWLEKHQIEAIIGHNIQFDLSFLKQEHWFLPETYKTIDTANLARVLFPQISAINLEYLQSKLELELPEQTLDITNPQSHKGSNKLLDSPTKTTAHRALYDLRITAQLLAKELQLLNQANFPKEFHTVISQTLLPLNLTFYTTKKSKKSTSILKQVEETTVIPQKINFKGEIIQPSPALRLNHLEFSEVQKVLNDLLSLQLPIELHVILLQIYTLIFLKQTYTGWDLKIHKQSDDLSGFVNIVLDILESQQPKAKAQSAVSEDIPTILPRLENLISQFRQLTESSLDITLLIDLFEFYFDILGLEPAKEVNRELLTQLQKTINSFDFVNLALNPLWLHNEYTYQPKSFNLYYEKANRRLQDFLQNLIILQNLILTNNQNKHHLLLNTLRLRINQLMGGFELDPQKSYIVRHFGTNFNLNLTKTKLDISLHFENLFAKYPNLQIQTYFNLNELDSWLELIQLPVLSTKRPQMQSLATESAFDPSNKQENQKLLAITKYDSLREINISDLSELFSVKLRQAKEQQKLMVILSGQNSALKECEKILTENFHTTDYLILGESGSLTKVGSKLSKNFVGLLVIKEKDFNFINNLTERPEIGEIWLLNQPYLILSKYWQTKLITEEKILDLKKLLLQAELNFLFAISQKPLFYLKSYNSANST